MDNELPPLRRCVSTYFLQLQIDPHQPEAILKLPLSLWHERDDTFEHADSSVLEQLAIHIGLSPFDFIVSHQQRVACLKELARGKGADMREVYDAIRTFREQALQETNH